MGAQENKQAAEDAYRAFGQGDVVVRTTSWSPSATKSCGSVRREVSLEGESAEAADVLTHNSEGRLVAFEQLGDPTIANRVFAK